MLKKNLRLKTKDVIYLTKKRNYFGHGFFGFFFVKQYPNIKYSQISFHVSIKYNKNSSARNIIKRAVIAKAKEIIDKSGDKENRKIFVVLNKNKIAFLQKEFENKDKKDIIASVQTYFEESFNALQKHL